MSMELRQLKYFKAIADARSFVRGADHLHVAQSALSRSIAKLEDEMGCPLFVRHSDGVTLTEAGRLLYEHGERVLRQVQTLKDEVAADAAKPRGPVAFGAPPALQMVLTAPAAARFIRNFPEAHLTIVQETSARLREGLQSGQLDVVVCSTLAPVQGLSWTPLFRENLCLICREDDRDWRLDEVAIEDLIDFPLVLCGFPATFSLYLNRAFARIRHKPRILCEANTASLVANLVAEGVGLGIGAPGVLPEYRSHGLRAVPIRELTASWVLATSYERMGSRGVQQLGTIVTEHVRAAITHGDWPTAIYEGPAAPTTASLADPLSLGDPMLNRHGQHDNKVLDRSPAVAR